MARITLKYDAKNTLAKKTIDYILSLGVFSVESSRYNKETEKAIEEARLGKTIKAKNSKELFEKLSA